MAQYQNLTGTTSKTFKIGKFGTTLSIGTVNLYDTSIQYLQSDTALLTNKVLLDATGNTYIDSSNYTGNANTANKLKNSINFQITGGATSDSIKTDLSNNVTLTISSLDATKISGNIPWANVSSLAGTTANSFALGNHNHNSSYAPINASVNFVGNVTGSGAINSDITLNIADGAVTNAKVTSITPSKIVGVTGNTTIGSSTNVINLYGKSNTSGEADYAKNLKSSADHAIVLQTNNLTSFLSPGSNGELLQTTGAGNNPTWVSPSSLTVSHASTAASLSSTVNAGSANLPIYFKNGLPVQTSTTLNVSITGNASTATKADSATHITNGKSSYSYSTIEDLIANTARKVQVGSGGSQYTASNNVVTIPAYTEGATKVEKSSINGKVKINGVDTVVYNDSDLVSKVSTNTTNITSVSNNLTSHVTNLNNPHGVTKAQVGLGSVVNKPQTSAATDISGATSTGTTASYYTRAYDVKTYVENKLNSNLTLGGNVQVNGNLTVKGSTITLDAQNLSISDQLLELYKREDASVPLTGYAGIYVNNYTGEANNKIEGLFVDASVNAYVGTATISGNTLSNGSMNKLATESYVTTQLSNNEEVEVLDIDIAEDPTASTLVKRTSAGLIKANTPTASSASSAVINLDYLGKVDKVLTPNADNTIDVGTATKAYKTVYANKIQSANTSTLTLSASKGIVINNAVSPNATNSLNLGASDKQWDNIYGKVLYENGKQLSTIYQAKGEYLTATDIANKLDKSTSASKVYGTDSSGNQAMYSFGTGKAGNSLVYRDSSGNFSANVITATLSGNASTATKATQDSQGNVISSTYFKNTGGILTNVSTASSNKNFSINSYTYAGSVNGVIDYVATSTGNSLHIGGNSADKDDRGVQKLEFTVTDTQQSTSKTPILTLTKGNISVSNSTNIIVGSNVNIGSSTNKVNSIYTTSLYLNGKDVSKFYNNLQDTTGTVQSGVHNSTTVISEITASDGTLQYKKVKLPAESNNRVTQTLVTDNTDYNLLFTSASTTTAQASTQFNTGIKVNPNTGTIKATLFSGRATSAENVYVNSSTSVTGSAIKSAVDKVEKATSSPDASTIVYRNADKSTSITKLYTNEIHPISTSDTLTIEGKASQAGEADVAKSVYNNGTATNALTFNTGSVYTNSNAKILVQAPDTNVVKYSTIKGLIDTVNVAYQNGTYTNMTVGEANHAAAADSASKAETVKHETALSGTSYRLALAQSSAAGYYSPRISDISVKGSVITATLSGNASTATTANNISGGAINSLVYQTTTGVTGFISYPADVTTTDEFVLTAQKSSSSNVISWVKKPYVKRSGDTLTGALTLKAGTASATNNNIDTTGNYDISNGGLNANNSDIRNTRGIYFKEIASDTIPNGLHFYNDANSFSSLYAKNGKLYFDKNRASKQAGSPVEVLTAGSVTSTSVVTNLNADLLDGNHASAFSLSTHTHSNYVDKSEGLKLKGTLTSSNNIIPLPVAGTALTGDMYLIGVDGTLYANGNSSVNSNCSSTVEAGDMIVASKDSSGTVSWSVIQKNVERPVSGPTSSTANAIPKFDGTTGKLIKNTGVTISDDNLLSASMIVADAGPSSYIRTIKLRGSGNAASYEHAIDLGYSGRNQVDFYEYGGLWNFWKNTTSTATTASSNLCLQIGTSYLKNKENTFTWPTQSGTFALTSDLSSYTLKETVLAASTNLNNTQTSGFYKLPDGANAVVNGPGNVSAGQLMVCHGGGDSLAQLAFPYDETKMYIRTGSTSTWKQWKRVVTDDELTKNKIITLLGYTPSDINDAIEYKGTLTSLTLPQGSSTKHGDAYIMGVSGALVNNTTNGSSTVDSAFSSLKTVEVGDMIIANKTDKASNNVTWSIIQRNVDNNVVGLNNTHVVNTIPVWNATSGGVLKDTNATVTASTVSGSTKTTITADYFTGLASNATVAVSANSIKINNVISTGNATDSYKLLVAGNSNITANTSTNVHAFNEIIIDPDGYSNTVNNVTTKYPKMSLGSVRIDGDDVVNRRNIGTMSVSYATTAGTAASATTATKAIQDGNGNTITSKYATLDTQQNFKEVKSFGKGIVFGNNTSNTTYSSGGCKIVYNSTDECLDFIFN